MWIFIVIAIIIAVVFLVKKAYPNKQESNNVLYSEESLRGMTNDELDKIYLDMTHIVMPAFDEPDTKRIPSNINSYGCKTWGEARRFMDLVAKVHNEKLKDKH